MWPGYQSGKLQLTRAIQMTTIIVLTLLSLSAFSHPDLVLQIESFDLQLESDPANVELLIKRGDLYRRHGNYAAAANDFAKVKKFDPYNALLDFYVGRLLFDSGDAAAADIHFEKYLYTHPQHAKAWILRGEAAIVLRQPELAATYFALAIKATPSPSPALYRLQILSLIVLGEKKWVEASQVVDQGLEHFGFEVSLIGLGTDIALAGNQVDLAGQYLERVPPSLRKLSQWDVRIQTKQCLIAADPNARKNCLHEANLRIQLMKNEFMGGR